MFHNGQDVFSISSAMLPRGKACLNCKHRKMKCDGEQPMCGPCTRLERRDCEYIQGKARSSTHGLEKKITGLRSRLKELQGVGGESGRHSNPPTAVPAPTPATGLSDPLYKPSSQEVSQLMDVFFSRDTQLWFLHRDRFRNAATLSQDRPDPAPAALVYAVCLAGAVSATPSTACEAALLARAISSLNDALSRDPLAALQTHILLAAYLLSCGRILEGRTQLSSAASLALSCGLHHTRSRRGCTPGGPIEPIPLTTLPAPRDQITEGERINGFWTTLTLERIWGAALGVPGRIQPASPPFSQGAGVRVDLPWPLVMDQYEQGWIDRSMLSSDTIWNFMRGGIGTWEEANALTLTTKSAILLERSLANVNDPAEIQALDRHITKLCPVTAADPRGRAANILLRGAIMYLHSRDIRAVEAARDLAAIAGTLRPAPKDVFGFLEAAVAAVVPRACRLLIAVSATRLDPSTNHQLDALQNVLAAWAQRSPFIDVQLSRVQQERDSL